MVFTMVLHGIGVVLHCIICIAWYSVVLHVITCSHGQLWWSHG